MSRVALKIGRCCSLWLRIERNTRPHLVLGGVPGRRPVLMWAGEPNWIMTIRLGKSANCQRAESGDSSAGRRRADALRYGRRVWFVSTRREAKSRVRGIEASSSFDTIESRQGGFPETFFEGFRAACRVRCAGHPGDKAWSAQRPLHCHPRFCCCDSRIRRRCRHLSRVPSLTTHHSPVIRLRRKTWCVFKDGTLRRSDLVFSRHRNA